MENSANRAMRCRFLLSSPAPLSLKPHAESPCAFTKRLFASLKNIAYRFANIGVFETAGDIRN